jgi:dTDP-glucose 4,6-dehydratase
MRRLLVTGGAGFIGANFSLYWVNNHPGDRLVILDALTYAGNQGNLLGISNRPEYRFVHGDIRETQRVESLLRDERIDTIVHFAAESHVDRSIEGPDAFIDTNVLGTHSLLKAARRVWLDDKQTVAHRFHHVSTDEVYGSLKPNEPAFSETTPYAPNSPYSASKAASDHLVRAYAHTYGLQSTITNCSNNYGPLQFPEKLIPVMISQLLAGKALPVYGDGRNVRDWLHVEDHCRGIEVVLDRGHVGETYNIGGDSECENIALVRLLCTLVDEQVGSSADLRKRYPQACVAHGTRSEQLISFVKDRPGHDRRYAIDASKIERECGFRPAVGLEEGLRGTVAWYLEHPDRLRGLWQRAS